MLHITMLVAHILKLAASFEKLAVFDHKPEDMCCGGTMVRSECPYHKDQLPKQHMHRMTFRNVNTNGVAGAVLAYSSNPPTINSRASVENIPGAIGEEITALGTVVGIVEKGDHTIIDIRFDKYILLDGVTKRLHSFLWYPM
jgi:hypothetical protein